jgi:peptidoglycan/LPS O-acetylase OafA/YrhL
MNIGVSVRRAELPLTAFRLLLSILVIVSHAGTLSGHPFVLSIGGILVPCFFALSGLLVTMSAIRSTPQRYVLARMRRILPAYLVTLSITALLLAPTVFALTHGGVGGFHWLQADGPIAYLLGNAPLSVNMHYTMDGVFDGTNVVNTINGSIWTLPVEIRAYALALLVVAIGRRIGLTKTMVGTLTVTTALLALSHADLATVAVILPEFLPPEYLPLLYVFFCGAVVATVADRFVLSHRWGIASLVVVAAATQAPEPLLRELGLGPLVLAIPYVASLLPTRPFRWFTNDLSYGTYLWGMPVQQVLTLAGIGSLGLYPYMAFSVLCTLPLAVASWFLVERRFLQRRA